MPCGTNSRVLVGLNSPDVGESALEISSQDELYIAVGVVSPDQAFRQIENLSFVSNPIQIVFPGCVTARVATYQIDIAPDSHVLHSGQLGHVVDVVEKILDGGWPARRNKIANHRDPDDTARS